MVPSDEAFYLGSCWILKRSNTTYVLQILSELEHEKDGIHCEVKELVFEDRGNGYKIDCSPNQIWFYLVAYESVNPEYKKDTYTAISVNQFNALWSLLR